MGDAAANKNSMRTAFLYLTATFVLAGIAFNVCSEDFADSKAKGTKGTTITELPADHYNVCDQQHNTFQTVFNIESIADDSDHGISLLPLTASTNTNLLVSQVKAGSINSIRRTCPPTSLWRRHCIYLI